ncbi:hypothetical protein A2368_04730 [Candidatus Collierbacteria bacterium RIFOXYB1_FULL_49_13]|uniref:Ribosomal protein n=1 Tax=Candidatus Collierbacteria bacterium RIFOXYB1_FULL_49_13 TaxID=1817728 RepID=A0A1F5FJN6_9BACT|nr:MAG: hypothetical protein A2368_04730 [Candidatus Collierbacteria bacterium RIFOXYB1_FULL_49_13]
MTKQRTVTTDLSAGRQESPSNAKFSWELAYIDLQPKTATILKDARVKPDQLRAMADGEVLAIPGVTDAMLEEIRAHYQAGLVDEVKDIKKEDETKKHDKKQAVAEAADNALPAKSVSTSPRMKYPRHLHGRSALYKSKLGKLGDKTYTIANAVSLLKTISYSRMKTVELHLTAKDTGLRGEIKLPFSVGKEIKVAIFSPELLETIKSGKFDFDILLATPADMPKVAPLAKILGPRGLMPNPKNNTVVDNPVKRAEELKAGATLAYKTEPKAPLIHLSVGNLNQTDDELAGNIKAILNGIGVTRLKNATLKSTMSPGIKLDINL